MREEAEEVARAAADESDERVAEEAADVLYHLQVLLRSREVPLSAVMETLNGRRALSAPGVVPARRAVRRRLRDARVSRS